MYSDDTLHEYIEKLVEKHYPETAILKFLRAILRLGSKVEIDFFHLPAYPEDPDDISFVLCAENGHATHLISYDKHILDLRFQNVFGFQICRTIEFLKELRDSN